MGETAEYLTSHASESAHDIAYKELMRQLDAHESFIRNNAHRVHMAHHQHDHSPEWEECNRTTCLMVQEYLGVNHA